MHFTMIFQPKLSMSLIIHFTWLLLTKIERFDHQRLWNLWWLLFNSRKLCQFFGKMRFPNSVGIPIVLICFLLGHASWPWYILVLVFHFFIWAILNFKLSNNKNIRGFDWIKILPNLFYLLNPSKLSTVLTTC